MYADDATFLWKFILRFLAIILAIVAIALTAWAMISHIDGPSSDLGSLDSDDFEYDYFPSDYASCLGSTSPSDCPSFGTWPTSVPCSRVTARSTPARTWRATCCFGWDFSSRVHMRWLVRLITSFIRRTMIVMMMAWGMEVGRIAMRHSTTTRRMGRLLL